jgi:hypothetical protein
MVRSFDGRAIDADQLVGICAEALRAPTAGNCAGVSMTVIDGERISAFFIAAADDAWRRSAPRAPGLMRAGAAVVVTSEPETYVRRYREPDKSSAGLGELASWPVPYWHTDAAMATMALLLLIEEADWAATIWGAFRREDEILRLAGASQGSRLFGSVIIGHADGADRRSASLDRAVPRRADRVRRLGV